MTKSRTITLAGSPLEVPMLPIRFNKIAYPLCRKLHNSGFMDRIIEGQGQVDCSAEEMDDLIEIAFAGACAALPQTTREEFDNWPITPPELVDAFFLIRYQTGAWIAPPSLDNLTNQEEAETQPGEAQGADTLQT
jgi:hypothetical protein